MERWRSEGIDEVVREDFGGEMEFLDRGEHCPMAFWGRWPCEVDFTGWGEKDRLHGLGGEEVL